ncbi:GlxA family transcriptional regulator [Sphingosinicella microcystinivorans]|nr:GlxA family transcriptional regulator [Sphingosinicella microcystinivorans]
MPRVAYRRTLAIESHLPLLRDRRVFLSVDFLYDFDIVRADGSVAASPVRRARKAEAMAKMAGKPQTEATPAKARLRVGFVLAPRFTLTAFSGFIDAIRLAADDGDRSRPIDCSWAVLGDEDALIPSSCAVSVTTTAPLCDPASYDYIAVVGGLLHGGQKVLPGTYSFLKGAARVGVPLIGLCTGSFILARAGLLDGYECCVSWLHSDEFVTEFPDLRVQSNRMFIVDRDRLTCAGGTSVVHLAAHLIERSCSRAQAIKALRIMIEEQPLPSGAWQPEAIVTRQARDGLVRQAMLLVEQNLGEPQSLATLAATLGISTRQIERRFMADVGISLREYRLRLRLSRARWMVAHTDRSMTEIALECGFNDGSHLARFFKEHFGKSPSEHRRELCSQDPVVG